MVRLSPLFLSQPASKTDHDNFRPSLHSLSTILSQNLLSLSSHLSKHHDLLSSLVVYPLPNFPAQEQETLLGQLLRKKLEPKVEEWVEQGRRTALEATATPSAAEGGAARLGLRDEDLTELWDWAGRAANDEARRRDWGEEELFTLEEREAGLENVVTGLRRSLLESQDESEEEEDGGVEGEMEIVSVRKKPTGEGIEFDVVPEGEHKPPVSTGPSLRLDEILRLMSTGVEPTGVGI